MKKNLLRRLLLTIVKHIGKGLNNANASLFMTYDAAMPIFRVFIGECKSNE